MVDKVLEFFTEFVDLVSLLYIDFITFFEHLQGLVLELNHPLSKYLVVCPKEIHEVSDCLLDFFGVEFSLFVGRKIHIVQYIEDLVFDVFRFERLSDGLWDIRSLL